MIRNLSMILLISGICVGCSTGKTSVIQPSYLDIKNVKDLTIQFDKTIETNFTASGTLRVHKKGEYLILYDGHVEAFRLACIEYSTGKEIWKVPYDVRGYWFFEDKILIEGLGSLEMIESKTGKSVWKKDPGAIRFDYGEGTELGEEVYVLIGGKDAILNLKDGNIVSQGKPVVGGFWYKEDLQRKIDKRGIALENKYGLSNQFYKVAVVEDRETARDIYIWELDDTTRTFTLSVYGHNDVLFKKHTWTIPTNSYTDSWDIAFSGLPEPEKLSGRVYCTSDLLILYESYENYRWSWGRGCNRITAIDLHTHEIKYQIWGQSPEQKDFHGFCFFDDVILRTNGTMHIQEGLSTFSKFDMKNGKVLDTLSQRFNTFNAYLPGILLGFKYENKQIADDKYSHSISIIAWDHQKDEYSKTFDFDFKENFPYWPNVSDDGTIIFYYYDKNLKKDVLYCCKIIPKL